MDDFDPTVTNSPKFRLIAVQCESPVRLSHAVPLRREPSEEKRHCPIVGWLPRVAASTLLNIAPTAR